MLFSDQSHWPKLQIVHCGVEVSKYGNRPRDTFGKRILFIGRLDAVKGTTILLEAFKAALKAHPDASLTIVGAGPASADLYEQTRVANIEQSVRFLGYRAEDEIADLLEKHDMLVLPSFAEGVPVVLMEAMASGIPVIATRVGGVAELVDDGKNGFLLPPGNISALVEALEKLMSKPDLCRRMGLAGRRKVEQGFDIGQEVKTLLGLISKTRN